VLRGQKLLAVRFGTPVFLVTRPRTRPNIQAQQTSWFAQPRDQWARSAAGHRKRPTRSRKTAARSVEGARTVSKHRRLSLTGRSASPPLPKSAPDAEGKRHHHVCRKVFSPSRWQSGCGQNLLRSRRCEWRRLGQMNTRAAATACRKRSNRHRWPSSPRTAKRPHLVRRRLAPECEARLSNG